MISKMFWLPGKNEGDVCLHRYVIDLTNKHKAELAQRTEPAVIHWVGEVLAHRNSTTSELHPALHSVDLSQRKRLPGMTESDRVMVKTVKRLSLDLQNIQHLNISGNNPLTILFRVPRTPLLQQYKFPARRFVHPVVCLHQTTQPRQFKSPQQTVPKTLQAHAAILRRKSNLVRGASD